ncbi:MAG TPA: type II secretion system protein GspE, partial [Parvularculaceae bacterium]|nr:type II secretion system protein GspE [Parvularculaceae bacterium]
YEPDSGERALLGIEKKSKAAVFRPVGCGRCAQTGFEGRIGVYELIIADEKLKTLIHDDAGEQEIAAYAFRKARTLAQCGFAHVLAGVTSLEEVLRVVRQEGEDAGV